MRRDEFLAQPVVDEFVNHLAGLLDGAPFEHAYIVRDRALPAGHPAVRRGGRLRLENLQDAFRQSWWRGESYEESKPMVDELRASVRAATQDPMDRHAPELYFASLIALMTWATAGQGASAEFQATHAWAHACGRSIVARLEAGRREMESIDADPGVFDIDVGPRINGVLSRWYALVCQDSMVYDGRIGAALGLLVRRFCEATGRTQVPAPLAFRWAPPARGGMHNRDPGTAGLRFDRLPASGGAAWAIANLRANWIVQEAMDRCSAGWCGNADGLRRVEAALFTIGFEVPSH
jgi:hypothetical protein